MSSFKIYLYGFNKIHEVVKFQFIVNETVTVKQLISTANYIRLFGADEVYAVDNGCGMYNDFLKSKRSCDPQDIYMFYDRVKREGILIL